MSTACKLVAGVGDLVMLPEAYVRIQSLLADPNTGMEDFARAVQSDPALTARVLRIANSALFGVSRRVDTVTLALGLMGISRLHDLVLATAVIGSLARLPVPGIDLNAFWRRSIHTGITARMLAAESGIFDSERLFATGLLHDIGHLVMYLRVPQQAEAARLRSLADSVPLHLAERELLGFHYGDVGAELMASWSFPDSLQELCRFHPEPQRAPRHPRECSLLHIARHCVLRGDPDPETLAFLPGVSPSTLEHSKLGAAAVARVESASYQHLIEAVELMLPKRA